MTTERDWVNELITRFQLSSNGVVEFSIGDTVIKTTLAKDMIEFFKENRAILLTIGMNTFRQFLLLICEKKEEEAFNLLLSKMSAEDIIKRMQMNAQSLDRYNKDRDKFVAALRSFFIKTVTPAILKVIIGLLI